MLTTIAHILLKLEKYRLGVRMSAKIITHVYFYAKNSKMRCYQTKLIL